MKKKNTQSKSFKVIDDFILLSFVITFVPTAFFIRSVLADDSTNISVKVFVSIGYLLILLWIIFMIRCLINLQSYIESLENKIKEKED